MIWFWGDSVFGGEAVASPTTMAESIRWPLLRWLGHLCCAYRCATAARL